MFDQKLDNNHPPHRQYDHKIPFKEDTEPSFGPLYRMSRDELLVLKGYVIDNLEKTFIHASSSTVGPQVQCV